MIARGIAGAWLAALAFTQPLLADTAELSGDVRAHDPSSVAVEGDRHYVFTTGWGLRAKSSADLLTWTDGPPVFPSDKHPAWIDDFVPEFRGHYWAPDIVRVGNRFRLYYSASRFGKQTSAIGLATSGRLDPADPAYDWQDEGAVVTSAPGDPYNAIDPSVLIDADGKHWLAFGSYWKGIYLMRLNPATGLALDPQAPKTRVAHAEMIEAATLLRRGDWVYLFVNHGLCCRGVESTYKILVGRSKQVTGPYVDREGRPLLEGGGTLVLQTDGPRIGPGHVAPFAEAPDSRFAFHYYDGNQRGRSKLAIARWRWSDDGWPAAADVQLSGLDRQGPPRRPNR